MLAQLKKKSVTASSERIKRMNFTNSAAKNIFLFFALISIFTTIGIIISLLRDSIGFFKMVSLK
ncbi:MAG: hypothetical protein N2484_15390, partial [Clostridia bacterium]|nr:hypothetical protein [Clostridia bacterium]